MWDEIVNAVQSRAASTADTGSVYRKHRDGAVVRSVASLLMWLTAIPARFAGNLDDHQLRGITVVVAYLVLMNLPVLWLARRHRSRVGYERLSVAVHACEVLGYTAIIHFSGGIEAAFLTPIYCGLVAYVGVVAPRRHLFMVAAMCGGAFCSLVMLEHLGVLPSYPLFIRFQDTRLPWTVISVILAIVTALIFVVAVISARTADLLKASRRRLRDQKDLLEREIAAHRRTEVELRAAVEEKQLLLKEVHHRVKNNLQVISSLLKLQAEGMPNHEIRNALVTAQGRVRSMAIVHEMFYSSGDLRQVDLEPFLRSLTAYLISAYELERSPVELRARIDSVQVELDTAIRIGLVVNELVTNALKHAFPTGREPGLLDVSLTVDGEHAQLTVADSGGGLPDGLEWRTTETLGLQLVGNLARELHGDLRIDTDAGTAFHLRFPVDSGALATAADTA